MTTVDRARDDRMPDWKAQDRWRCVRGTKGHEPPESLRPAETERVVDKTYFSAFSSGELDRIVSTAAPDTLIVAGVHLHGSVRATVLDAYARRLEVLVAEDAVASDDPLHAAITQRYLEGRAARFLTVDAILRRYETGTADSRTQVERLPAAVIGGQELHPAALPVVAHSAPRQRDRLLFTVPVASHAEALAAVRTATEAQRSWASAGLARRTGCLERLAETLESAAEPLARTMAEDVGKPIRLGRAEVRRAAALLRAAAAAEDVSPRRCGPGSRARRLPLGVVAVVTPWNNPIAIPIGKIGPALSFSNAVIWKPAPAATRAALQVLALLQQADVPPGVVCLLAGDHETAGTLMRTDGVGGVSISGSSRAGWAAQEICAARRIPLQAELGGNNAAIVWQGADLPRAAERIARGAFAFAGQRCTANRRAVVDANVYDDFQSELIAATKRIRCGDPLDPETEAGPLISEEACRRVTALLDRAREGGVSVVTPHAVTAALGALREMGAYLPPTLVFGAAAKSEIVTEETFGPVLVVQRAADFSEALALCNGVPQGLVAALFGGSPEQCRLFLEEARAGILKLDDATADADALAPFGGWKASGIGPPEHGPGARELLHALTGRLRGNVMSGPPARSETTRPERIPPALPRPNFAPAEVEQSVSRRFESIVRAYPERVATRASGQQWTYAMLDAAADRIARGLQSCPHPNRPIALWLPAGPTLFAAMLGTLKAHRFYVPLDPAFAPSRLRAILVQADAAAILTDGRSAADAARESVDGAPILRVEEMATEGPPDGRSVASSPDDLAYILFTSGSTGNPKGVMQSHRNLLHNILKLSNGLGIVPDDRLTLLSSCSFGASISDIYGALLNGAAVCPFSFSAGGLLRFRAFLVEEGITILHCVPSLFRQLAASLDGSEDLSRLRLIKLGGEPVLSSDFELYRKHFPRTCIFHVGLGATEMHVIRQWFADHDSVCPTSIAPLGYAVDGTEVLLLDEKGRPTSGDTGEIAVVSRTLAIGYWKRPDLTAKAFLPVPDREGERMFRSGDLGRLLPDGCLVYVGRGDSRMKIRGHWVELAEVEAALNALPGDAEAAIAASDGPGGTRLIAYVVAAPPDHPGAGAMRQALSERLPEWMIPTLFLFLSALPRTTTGKIDRSALPAPNASRPELQEAFAAPRSSLEEKIARIWCEILGLEKVGVHDNFFDLGGHSLLAAQLVAKIEKQLRVPVALATIFRAATVAELAEMLQARGRSGSPLPSLVAVQPKGPRPPFFCVHSIFGIVNYRQLALALGPDQPFYGLQAQGLDGRRRPYETVEEMAAHYVREIRLVQPEGPYYLGGHSFGGKVAFEMARQLRAKGDRIALLALIDARNLPAAARPTRFVFARQRTQTHLETLKRLRMIDKISYLLRRAQTLSLLAVRPLSRGYDALFRPLRVAERNVLAANRRAAARYVPTFYGGRITLFRAKDRWKGSRPDAPQVDPHLGWQGLSGKGVEVHEVPGDHESIMEDEANTRALGEKLSECLLLAQGPPSDESPHSQSITARRAGS